MGRLVLAVVALVSTVGVLCAQTPPKVEDRLDEVLQKLDGNRRSEANAMLARASGAGRRVIRGALVAAGKIPRQTESPAKWSDKKTLQLAAAQMARSQRDLFTSIHTAMSKEDRELLAEMLRVRAALPPPRVR